MHSNRSVVSANDGHVHFIVGCEFVVHVSTKAGFMYVTQLNTSVAK